MLTTSCSDGFMHRFNQTEPLLYLIKITTIVHYCSQYIKCVNHKLLILQNFTTVQC